MEDGRHNDTRDPTLVEQEQRITRIPIQDPLHGRALMDERSEVEQHIRNITIEEALVLFDMTDLYRGERYYPSNLNVGGRYISDESSFQKFLYVEFTSSNLSIQDFKIKTVRSINIDNNDSDNDSESEYEPDFEEFVEEISDDENSDDENLQKVRFGGA